MFSMASFDLSLETWLHSLGATLDHKTSGLFSAVLIALTQTYITSQL